MRSRSEAEREICVGVDLVAVERMARLVSENQMACNAFLTVREWAACRGARHEERVAGRFAAKEAVLKAFGTGLSRGMRWTDVEIVRGRGGRPRVELHGQVALLARSRGLASLDVSVTHSAGLAVAHAVAVWERECDSTS